MAENKTKPTGASVADFIAAKASPQQAKDARALMAMFKRLTRKTPYMYGPSIVGYGAYRYKYASGKIGEAPLVAFAIRGPDLVVYLSPEQDKTLLSRLGKHKIGKSCLYFRQLDDLDPKVFEKLVVNSINEGKRQTALT